MEPLAAALKGSEQIGFTILSLTVSLIAVLIPLLFMGDVVGRLFREFAVTLSITILVSAVVSLTLTPMMCARLLRRRPAAEQGRFYRASERVFERILAFYGRTLEVVLEHQHGDPRSWPSGRSSPRPPLPRDPQGVLPGAGHRRDPRRLRGRRRPSPSRRWPARQQALAQVDPRGPRGREPVVVHRRRRHQHDAQQRPHPDQPEAARRARSASASEVIRRLQPRPRPRGRRHHALHAAGAGPDGRGPGQPDAVPVHPGGARMRTSSPSGRRVSWRG